MGATHDCDTHSYAQNQPAYHQHGSNLPHSRTPRTKIRQWCAFAKYRGDFPVDY
jgi:hypothetical protein